MRILWLLLIVSAELVAATRQLHWAELETVIVGQQVRVVMPNAQVIEGKAVRVDSEALVMEVRRTSNPAIYPKTALYSVPRSSLKALQVRRMTKRWRIMFATVGTVVGLGFGIAASLRVTGSSLDPWKAKGEHNLGGAATAAAVAIALPVGGYFLGKAADKHTTDITILP